MDDEEVVVWNTPPDRVAMLRPTCDVVMPAHRFELGMRTRDSVRRQLNVDLPRCVLRVWGAQDVPKTTDLILASARDPRLCTQAVLPGMLASPGSVVSPGSKGVAKRGTILYTSTTGAFRSMAKTARLSAGKMALRALSQSVAKEYGKQGVHAVHLRMDCTYESARNKDMFEAMGMGDMFQQATAANKLASIDDLAETFYTLHMQSPMAWTNELDLRPYTEDCKL